MHAFHLHIAKQVELCCLEWTSSQEICDKAVTFFQHSDLKSSQLNTSSGSLSATLQFSHFQPHSPSMLQPEVNRARGQWNYYGSCSCHKSNLETLQRPSQMSCLHEGASHASLSKEKESYSAPDHKLHVTTREVLRIAYFPTDLGLAKQYLQIAFKGT